MQRRGFIGVLASLGALLLAGMPGRALAAFVPDEPDLARRLAATFRRPASAQAIGRAYLAAHPGEAAPARLATDLGHDLACRGCAADRAGPGELRRTLSAQIRDDFASGRTVRVDGWVLSRTEARLCALAELTRT